MSTKIFNGFKFKTLKSVDSVIHFVNSIRQEFNNEADSIWAKLLMSDAVLDKDYLDYTKGTQTESNLYTAHQKLQKELMLSYQKQIRSYLNLEVRLSVIKTKAPSTCVLGLFFIPNNTLSNKFTKLSEVKEYIYFEGKDVPTHIKPKLWEQRREHWGKVFSKAQTPDEAMFSIEVVRSGSRNVSKEVLTANIPTVDERYENLADEITTKELHTKEMGFTSHEEVFAYLESDEHKANIQEKIMELESEITLSDNDITVDDLLSTPTETEEEE